MLSFEGTVNMSIEDRNGEKNRRRGCVCREHGYHNPLQDSQTYQESHRPSQMRKTINNVWMTSLHGEFSEETSWFKAESFTDSNRSSMWCLPVMRQSSGENRWADSFPERHEKNSLWQTYASISATLHYAVCTCGKDVEHSLGHQFLHIFTKIDEFYFLFFAEVNTS